MQQPYNPVEAEQYTPLLMPQGQIPIPVVGALDFQQHLDQHNKRQKTALQPTDASQQALSFLDSIALPILPTPKQFQQPTSSSASPFQHLQQQQPYFPQQPHFQPAPQPTHRVPPTDPRQRSQTN
jgi:hypothetical protein